jgi:hypothetical protein
MKWFKHDATANMDAKLQEVLLDYGLEGYGLYWYCLELIAGNVEPGNMTFELEHDCRIIARNTGSTVQRVQEMMGRFVELGLFENSQGTITCLKMAKVSDDYTAKLIRSGEYSKKPQAIENKGVLQSPIKSEKVHLEENRTEENRTEKNTIGTSTDAPSRLFQSYMIVCPECGNKRCPKAEHRNAMCTGSNEPNQTPSFSSSESPNKSKPEKRKTKAQALFDNLRRVAHEYLGVRLEYLGMTRVPDDSVI